MTEPKPSVDEIIDSMEVCGPDGPYTLKDIRAAAERERAEGRREAFGRVRNWIDGRTLGYPHADLLELSKWCESRAAEEGK